MIIPLRYLRRFIDYEINQITAGKIHGFFQPNRDQLKEETT